MLFATKRVLIAGDTAAESWCKTNDEVSDTRQRRTNSKIQQLQWQRHAGTGAKNENNIHDFKYWQEHIQNDSNHEGHDRQEPEQKKNTTNKISNTNWNAYKKTTASTVAANKNGAKTNKTTKRTMPARETPDNKAMKTNQYVRKVIRLSLWPVEKVSGEIEIVSGLE